MRHRDDSLREGSTQFIWILDQTCKVNIDTCTQAFRVYSKLPTNTDILLVKVRGLVLLRDLYSFDRVPRGIVTLNCGVSDN